MTKKITTFVYEDEDNGSKLSAAWRQGEALIRIDSFSSSGFVHIPEEKMIELARYFVDTKPSPFARIFYKIWKRK